MLLSLVSLDDQPLGPIRRSSVMLRKYVTVADQRQPRIGVPRPPHQHRERDVWLLGKPRM